MKFKKSNIYIYAIILLLILIAILDLFLTEDDQNRHIAIFTQATVLAISLYFLLKSFVLKPVKLTGLHYSLLSFITMLLIYGMFSPYIDRLPVFIYGLVPFYLFYYAAYKNHIRENHIQFLATILFVIFLFETYLGIVDRAERLDAFFYKADNTGYNAMYLMLLFALNIKNSRNIVFLSMTYLLVLLSFKRGAMLIGTLSYLIIIAPLIFNKIELRSKTRKKLWVGGFVALSAIVTIVVKYWEIVAYRFITDKTGSGRAEFYAVIYRGWDEAALANQLFGFGFYKVPEYLNLARGTEIYAHSDWFQLLYDHGVLGLILYTILTISIISYKDVVKRVIPIFYPVYLMALCMLLLKALFSGVYINKGSIMLFMIIGIILGAVYREKKYKHE